MSIVTQTRVIAVVPLFQPTRAQIEGLSLLAEQVHHVVAVDDGSTAPGTTRTGPDAESVTIITTPTNSGIAHSLNVGIRHARSMGATHVLTTDQDSRLTGQYVENALDALAAAARAGVPASGAGAGMIGPHRLQGQDVLPGLRNGSRGIQSGWLLPVGTLEDLGTFDEQLFIDCVDVDFLMRAEVANRPILVTDSCAIEHALGTNERVLHLLGRRAVFSYHPPFRRYYITRNRLLMLRRYGFRQPGPMFEQFLLASRIAVLCVLFGDRRRAQVLAILAGVRDALIGRVGRIPARTERRIRGVKV